MYVLLDVDRTIIAPGDIVNISLIRVLRLWGCDTVDLVTSYSLKGNAKDNTLKNALRIDAIRRLSRYGIQVRHVYTSASPYREKQGDYKIGEYYPRIVRSIERSIIEQGRDIKSIEEILAHHEEIIKVEWDTIQKHIGDEQHKEEETMRGEKEHLMQHALANLPNRETKSIIFDDKPEVIYQAKKLEEDDFVTSKGLTFHSHRIDWHHGDDRMWSYEESLQNLDQVKTSKVAPYLCNSVKPLMVISYETVRTLYDTPSIKEYLSTHFDDWHWILVADPHNEVEPLEGLNCEINYRALKNSPENFNEWEAWVEFLGQLDRDHGTKQPCQITLVQPANSKLASFVKRDFKNDFSLSVVNLIQSNDLLMVLQDLFAKASDSYYHCQLNLIKRKYDRDFYEEDKSPEQKEAEQWYKIMEAIHPLQREIDKDCEALYKASTNEKVKQDEWSSLIGIKSSHPQHQGLDENRAFIRGYLAEICLRMIGRVMQKPAGQDTIIKERLDLAQGIVIVFDCCNNWRFLLEKQEAKGKSEGNHLIIQNGFQLLEKLIQVFSQVINNQAYNVMEKEIILPLLNYNEISDNAELACGEKNLIAKTIVSILEVFIPLIDAVDKVKVEREAYRQTVDILKRASDTDIPLSKKSIVDKKIPTLFRLLHPAKRLNRYLENKSTEAKKLSADKQPKSVKSPRFI